MNQPDLDLLKRFQDAVSGAERVPVSPQHVNQVIGLLDGEIHKITQKILLLENCSFGGDIVADVEESETLEVTFEPEVSTATEGVYSSSWRCADTETADRIRKRIQAHGQCIEVVKGEVKREPDDQFREAYSPGTDSSWAWHIFPRTDDIFDKNTPRYHLKYEYNPATGDHDKPVTVPDPEPEGHPIHYRIRCRVRNCLQCPMQWPANAPQRRNVSASEATKEAPVEIERLRNLVSEYEETKRQILLKLGR